MLLREVCPLLLLHLNGYCKSDVDQYDQATVPLSYDVIYSKIVNAHSYHTGRVVMVG